MPQTLCNTSERDSSAVRKSTRRSHQHPLLLLPLLLHLLHLLLHLLHLLVLLGRLLRRLRRRRLGGRGLGWGGLRRPRGRSLHPRHLRRLIPLRRLERCWRCQRGRRQLGGRQPFHELELLLE